MDWLTDKWTWLVESAQSNETFLGKGFEIWSKGGWAMWVLALVSLFIFAVGMGVWRRLRAMASGGVRELTWRRWILDRRDREGVTGELFDHVDEIVSSGEASVHNAFDEVRASRVQPFTRDLKLMQIAVSAAPLVGLLGTVTGMLATFNALAAGSGGDQTMTSIAEGISEALYTTETGLVVALPGLFFHYFLSRQFERYRAFLNHVEAVWAQAAIESRLEREEELQHKTVRALTRLEVEAYTRGQAHPAGA